METTGKTFQTEQAVSAITGRLVCDIGGVYEVLSYLLGRSLWTHELPGAMTEARKYADLPEWLATLSDDGVDGTNWQAWRDGLIAAHGPTVTLMPITYSALAEKSPIETAVEMFGADRVIAAEAPHA